MAQYLTYDEYAAYGGDLSEQDFVLEEFAARKLIDKMTLCRVQGMEVIPEEVKLAVMRIIKYNQRYSSAAQADNAIVSSYNTDGYSESYGGVSEQTENARNQLMREVSDLLFGVPSGDSGGHLRYLGVD